jgi:hypothetical protein
LGHESGSYIGIIDLKLKTVIAVAGSIASILGLGMYFVDSTSGRNQVSHSGDKSQIISNQDGTINIYNLDSTENKIPKIKIQNTASKLENVSPDKTNSSIKPYQKLVQRNIEYSIPSVKIKLSKPNTELLKVFKEKIQIEGKVEVTNVRSVFNFLRKEGLVLIPVIEGSDFYTYDSLSINSDGSFRYSWPISSEHMKGNIFWVSMFDRNGQIQPRDRYNISPSNHAKYRSDFVYFR